MLLADAVCDEGIELGAQHQDDVSERQWLSIAHGPAFTNRRGVPLDRSLDGSG